MLTLNQHPTGRHFLQIPGPSPVPDRILRAMSLPTIDHRGPEFGALGLKLLAGIQQVFQTRHPVAIYPASGTGAWEAALANTMSPGDLVLMYETGQFATLWQKMATRLGLKTEFIAEPGICAQTSLPLSWRRGVNAALIAERLRADSGHQIRAVCVVHNETSTGVTSDIAAVRRAIDGAKHPALLMVDTISGLASADYRHDEWGVDVAISGSQKGLMLPPGMALCIVAPRGMAAARANPTPRLYWDWVRRDSDLQYRKFCGTPPLAHLAGLEASLGLIAQEGLANVQARHVRLAAAVHAAVDAWATAGALRLFTRAPAARSASVTAVEVLAPGVDPEALRTVARERFQVAIAGGLGMLAGRVFRIGHLGDMNEAMILGCLAGVQAAMTVQRIPFGPGGVDAAVASLARAVAD